MKLRIGSRESKLAVIQSEIIINMIRKSVPEAETELVTMKTAGDRILDRTLDKAGGKGLFIKELDRALIRGDIDIAVHSLKDMPMETDLRLKIAAYSAREAPFDALVLPKGAKTQDFDKPVGCAGKRRAFQYGRLFPNAEIKPVRGNVLTRLARLDAGEYGALLLAEAGLRRLGLQDRTKRVFTAEEIVPAAGQGILAVVTRADAEYNFLSGINDINSELCARAERAFVRRLNGGCSAPAAAYAEIDGENIIIRGFNVIDGKLITKTSSGNKYRGEETGTLLAEEMM